jgi:hypothetical protein
MKITFFRHVFDFVSISGNCCINLLHFFANGGPDTFFGMADV